MFSPPFPKLGKSSSDRVRHGREGVGQTSTQRGNGHDDDNRDSGGNQTILDGGSARLILLELSEELHF